MRLILVVIFSFVVFGLKPESPKSNKRSIAVEIAETRVRIAEVDLEGAEKDRDLLKKKMDMVNRLRATGATSPDDHRDMSRIYGRSLTDAKRAQVRLDEAKALLKYAEEVGEVDLTLSSR